MKQIHYYDIVFALLNDIWINLFESDNISNDKAFQTIEKYLRRYMNNVEESPEWKPLIELLRNDDSKVLWNEFIKQYNDS
jgi:hypothetical protein